MLYQDRIVDLNPEKLLLPVERSPATDVSHAIVFSNTIKYIIPKPGTTKSINF